MTWRKAIGLLIAVVCGIVLGLILVVLNLSGIIEIMVYAIALPAEIVMILLILPWIMGAPPIYGNSEDSNANAEESK